MKEVAVCPRCKVLHAVGEGDTLLWRTTHDAKWIECEKCKSSHSNNDPLN